MPHALLHNKLPAAHNRVITQQAMLTQIFRQKVRADRVDYKFLNLTTCLCCSAYHTSAGRPPRAISIQLYTA